MSFLHKSGSKTNKSIIPAGIRNSLVGYWSGRHRDEVRYSLNNLVTNGNFANGVTGWGHGGTSTLTAGNNILTVTGNSLSAFAQGYATISTITGHKYYFRGKVKITNTSCTSIDQQIMASNWQYGNRVLLPENGIEYVLKAIIIADASVSGVFAICQVYSNAATANGKVMEVQNVMAFDLTATFGAGNEPTATEMDAILLADNTPYWEGSRSVICNPPAARGLYYPLNQLLVNGDFINGTTGWASTTVASFSVSNGEASFTMNGTNGNIAKVPIGGTPIGNKFYIVADIKADSNLVYLNMAGLSKYHTGDNTYQRLSLVSTAVGDPHAARLYDARTSGWTLIKAQKVMVFNLTAIFGSGNEPSAVDMDAILVADGTAYWDGTKVVQCYPDKTIFWADKSGRGHHIKFNAMAYTGISNLLRNGANFNGGTDYGFMLDSPATRLITGGSLCAWIYPRSYGETNGAIFFKGTSTAAANGYRLLLGTTNNIVFTVDAGSNTISTDYIFSYSQFVFIVLTFNGVERHIYANAIDVTNSGGNVTNLPPDIAGPVAIGNRAEATDRTFNGLLNDLMMFNRALTAGEVLQLFNLTRYRYGI